MPVELWSALIAVGGTIVGAGIAWLAATGADRRADAREARQVERDTSTRQAELARQAADEFLGHLTAVRQHLLREEQRNTPPLEDVFFDPWYESSELQLRQIVDRLSDAIVRRRLQALVEAPSDYEARIASKLSIDEYLLWIFSLGRDVAMATVRGEEPDTATMEELAKLAGYVDAAEAHRQLQRNMPGESAGKPQQ